MHEVQYSFATSSVKDSFYSLVCLTVIFGLIGCSGIHRIHDDETAEFDGKITEESVSTFLASVAHRHITMIVVDSGGGEPIAGIRLGEWIDRNSVSVQVEKVCFSSCANYVFPAGARKIIVAPGIVGWHGSAEQRNFRERDKIYEGIELRAASGEGLLASEVTVLGDSKEFADFKYSQASRPRQRAFYNTLGVNEYVTRAGQEPRYLGTLWTLTADDLKAFGICNIEEPVGYANSEYLALVRKQTGFAVKRLRLDADIVEMINSEAGKAGYRIHSCD